MPREQGDLVSLWQGGVSPSSTLSWLFLGTPAHINQLVSPTPSSTLCLVRGSSTLEGMGSTGLGWDTDPIHPVPSSLWPTLQAGIAPYTPNQLERHPNATRAVWTRNP